MKKDKSVNLQYICAVLIFSILLVIVAAEAILYSFNTLNNNPMWLNGKLLLAAPSMGANKLTHTRNLLNRNRLNLHEWHGSNEILLNEIFQLGSIRFNLKIGKNADISIIYNKKADSFSGVRLSRNRRFPSMVFLADPGGQFLQKQSIENLNLTDSWHTVDLIFQSQDMILMLDGNLVQRIPTAALKRQVVGFRSGGASWVAVDNVEVIDHNGRRVIKEDFRNVRHYWLLTVTLFGIVAGLICLVCGALKIAGISLKGACLQILIVEFCMINFLSMYWAFDYFSYSKRYPYQVLCQPFAGRDYKLRGFENIRMRCFDVFRCLDASDHKRADFSRKNRLNTFLKLNKRDTLPMEFYDIQIITGGGTPTEQTKIMLPSEVQKYLDSVSKPFYKILLLGSSQTWGEGALRQSDRMAHQIYRRLRELAGTPDILLVNASLKAVNSSALYNIYKERLHLMYPDLTVVNLSNNDRSLEKFEKNLNDIAAFSQQQNTALMFVQEANSFLNYQSIDLAQRHRVMAKVAEKNNILCLDMHEHLSSDVMVDSGFLWFDNVHLTSYGQKQAGELIAQHIFTILGP